MPSVFVTSATPFWTVSTTWLGVRTASVRAPTTSSTPLGSGRARHVGEHAVGRRGVAVDEDVADVDRADAVDEAVVGLGDDGEAVLGEALDEVDLPQRAGAVERARLDAGDELLELLVGAGTRQGAAPHVVAHVEVPVVDPHGVREAARHRP